MTRTPTLLSLIEWAEFIGMNPYYLFQVGVNVPDNTGHDCDYIFYEYPYQQSNHLSREDVRLAISQAEDLFNELCGYYPAPKFIVDEPGQYPQYYDKRFYGGLRNYNGQFKAIQLKHGYIQSVGVEVLTFITDNITITLSDSNGDGINDTFNFSVTVPSGTLASEIAVFNTETDRNDNPLDEYEIRPIKVTVSGTTATVTGFIGLLVIPDLQEVLDPESLDATLTTIYVEDLAVYRRTINTESPGQFIYESYCLSNNCDVETRDFCLYARDKQLGIVAPRVDICLFGRYEPDRFIASYYAGYPRQSNNRMDRKISHIISLLATSLLPNRTCGCSRADQRLAYYRDLPTRDSDGSLQYSQEVMEATSKVFGTMGRGAVEAYTQARRLVMFKAEVPQ